MINLDGWWHCPPRSAGACRRVAAEDSASSAAVAEADGSGTNGEMKCGAFAGIAFHPDLAAHQFDQPLADRQAESGAAIMAGGGGIHLLERFEQPVLLVEWNADAGVAHREMQQPLLGMAQKIGVLLAGFRTCQFASWQASPR